MIELIFVIVVIGVLASIAIPKMLATRDDAKVAVMRTDIENAMNEIASYAVSQKGMINNICKMSNSLTKLASSNEANCSEENITTIKMDGVDCIRFEVVHTTTNDELNVSEINSTNDLCKYLQQEIKPNLYEVRLNGVAVKF